MPCNNDLNDNYKGSGIALKRAMKKYGEENFITGIIEFCSADNLFEKEIEWIEKYKTFKTGYNLTKGGESKLGSICSEDTKEKMRNSLIGKPSGFKGQKMSEEHKEKIRQKKLGKSTGIGHVVSEKTRKKIGNSNSISLIGNKNAKKKILCI